VLGSVDRLGTVRAVATNGTWAEPTYFPYGEPKTAGGVDTKEQFATYVRDSTPSAQDYAMQRYYSNNTGRFYSTDKGAPDPKNPGSWNRYAYVGGDPVNRLDPSGRDWCNADDGGEDCPDDPCDDDNGCVAYSDPCGGGGYARGVTVAAWDDYFEDAQGRPTRTMACGATPAPSLPDQCSVSLWERPTPTSSSPGWHTYISTTVYDPNTGLSTTLDFEGGPQPAWAFVGGKLTGTIAPPGQGLNSGSSNDATNPSLPSNKEIGSAYTGASACGDVTELANLVTAYNQGAKVLYNFLAKGFGYNSNSFTFTLDSQLGLVSYFGQPAGWAPGWGKSVPGL
jgi:RHS repeat-associated protein